MMEKRVLPKFASEAEEADWWFENRDELAQDFVKAAEEGRLGRGTVARRMVCPPQPSALILPTSRWLATKQKDAA